MNKIMIGLSGKISSGKDSFADIAVDRFGFKKLSFAGLLKEEVKEFLHKFKISFTEDNIYGTQLDKEQVISFPEYFDYSSMVEEYPFLAMKCRDLTFRYLLQLWGTEYRRAQDPDYWIKAFNKQAQQYPFVVCSDLRFKNEYEYFRSIEAVCVRIERTDGFISGTVRHLSEIDLDDVIGWDYVIINNSTYEKYCERIVNVLNAIMEIK
jgi:hypothetical protein